MIDESPSLITRSLSHPDPSGLEPFLRRYGADATFYGSGKAALRDGLAGLATAGDSVLVPAYLPDAVIEPLVELDLEVRYYRVRETLVPDLADVERRIDDGTVAAMSVNYFGFPQPGLEAFTALIGEHDCYHVDDNAHGPFSVDDGTLLGTRGDLGIASLWKVLPVPDGALLYCNDERVARRYEPSAAAGVRETFGADDYRYVLKSIVAELLETNAFLRRSVDELVAGRAGTGPGSDPAARYEARKRPMSRLSARIVADVDPTAIRDARRRNFRAWRRVFDGFDDADVLFEGLPPGICPQVFPIRTATPTELLAALEDCGVTGAHTWPRLSTTVRDDPTYEVTQRLAREVVVLPVHQQIEPSAIGDVETRLRW